MRGDFLLYCVTAKCELGQDCEVLTERLFGQATVPTSSESYGSGQPTVILDLHCACGTVVRL